MKRFLSIAIIFLVTLFWVCVKPSPTYAKSYIEPTCDQFAHGLDFSRGWKTSETCPAPNDNGPKGPDDDESWQGSQEAMLGSAIYSGLYFMGGELTGMCKTTCTDERRYAFMNNSAIGVTNRLIASLYSHPPASAAYYAYDLLNNAGFVKPAYAQGIGFSGLGPVLPIWKAFRNISYIVIVVLLIGVGFMIMFRMEIKPQTVISIQNALPNIIVTLILITFSYAIAGLLIDLMYFSIMIIVSIFGQEPLLGAQKTTELQSYFVTANLGTLFGAIIWEESLVALPNAILSSGWNMFGMLSPGWGESVPILGQIGAGIVGTVTTVLGGITSVLMFVVLAITLFLVFVRTFFILLNCYIQIILSVVLAPFQLLFGAIPGKSTFRNWIMGLIGNLAVFPATVALVLLASAIAQLSLGSGGTGAQKLWVAPFLTGSNADPKFIVGLIGLGFVLLLPSLLTAVKDSFGAKPIMPLNIGTILQPAIGTTMQGFQLYTQRLSMRAAQKQLRTPPPSGEERKETGEQAEQIVAGGQSKH